MIRPPERVISVLYILAHFALEVNLSTHFETNTTTIAAFERRLWNADKTELFQRIERVDLLLLDDLFAERSSDYMRQITFDILDVRIGALKPLLITTNRTFDELMNGSTSEEKRILSRIHQGCNIVAMAGKDRRRERLVKNNDERIAELYNLGERPQA